MSNNIFVVGSGLNTSYIDSLIVALFYKSSHLQELLTQFPDDNKFVYLQEMISNNFVDQIRRNNSIDYSIVNEIRNYSFICGWKDKCNLTDLYNPVDYMKFLMNGIGFGNISFEIMEHTEKDNEIIKTLDVNFLEVNVSENITIKKLLEKWIDINIKRNKSSLIAYQFREVPLLIPIYVNRNNEHKGITNYEIDVMKKIRFKNNKNNKISWCIHSVICFSNSGGNTNYYSIVNTYDNNWYLFSNNKIPSFNKINIFDEYISKKIKQECVLVFYRLNDDLCKF